MAKRENEDEDEVNLINAEFESMVEGLGLDESSPTTYLDELDQFDKVNRFTPPVIPKRSIIQQYKDARKAIVKWFRNTGNQNPEDGLSI
jgi:AAA+ ATPase superfamily predicted ATPase